MRRRDYRPAQFDWDRLSPRRQFGTDRLHISSLTFVAAGRPRKVETCDAVEAAMGAFWRSGYKATSLSDLECATGLTKGSLYKAFTDKHDLFIQALDMYLSNSLTLLAKLFSQKGTALDRLNAWADLASGSGAEGGCLAVKTATELAVEDPEVRQVLITHWGAIEQMLLDLVSHGQAEGSIRRDFTSESIVRLLIRVAMGTAVASPLTSTEMNASSFKTVLLLIKP